MTGMGKDGLDGAREVRARGGRILAEAESSCTVYGMPRAIVEAQLADVVVPLGELAEAIAAEIGCMSHRHLQRRARVAAPATSTCTFCNALRHVCGIDLLQYKRGQMERRIRSFAATRGAADLAAYAATLADRQGRAGEVPRPRDDQRLAAVAQPGAVGDAGGADPPRPRRDGAPANRVRAWSAGCSYGAEAYTLAAIARRADPARRGHDPGHRHRRPDGRSAPAPASSRSRTPATRRPRRSPALRADRRRAGTPPRSSSGSCASSRATC